MEQQQLGIVKTEYLNCFEPPNELNLSSGEKLGPIVLAYETYGTLNSAKTNAVLICHALTGDAHVAGFHEGDPKPGWWDDMVGPGKPFDTDKYFVICSNVIGSCKGSTGPSSLNPKTGKPYGLSFPVITIQDMVKAQKRLIDHLSIAKLLSVAGGSMGGMQALTWAALFPEMVNSVIAIATNYRHSAQQIAFHEVGRQAIMSDPDWQGGEYYGKSIPARGLALSRMIGHITYMSEQSMEEKFGRKLFGKEKVGYDFSVDFEVGNYLKYRGDSFVHRFDANTYLYITKALDYFDLGEGVRDLATTFANCYSKFLVVSFTSDWLYPSYQSKELVSALKANDIDVSYIEIQSTYGHDAFLVENPGQSHVIEHFLSRMTNEISSPQ
jgi:homoserine O-acetyltransferase/O-succinyltransferase